MIYKVKLVSQTNAILLWITMVLVVSVSAGMFLPPGGLQNKGLSILAVSVITIVTYVLWQLFVTGQSVWTVDENGIKIVWTKQFTLSGSTDLFLKWSEIEAISRGFDPYYDKLKIRLISGDTIKYFHHNLTTKDDFEKLIEALHQTLKEKSYSE